MSLVRVSIISLVAFFGLAAGALFAFPGSSKQWVRVEVNGSSVLAEVARDPQSRSRGLSGRARLAQNAGMLFLFDAPGRHGFWMKGMKFPLDIFWIKNGAVADMEERVPAPRSSSPPPIYRPDIDADMVLEVPAGFAEEHRVRIGDPIAIGSRLTAPAVALAASEAASLRPELAAAEYFIENLRAHPAHGAHFQIKRILDTTDAYRKFAVSYESRGMTLTGVMNVPMGPVPSGGFPVLILNHGLINPDVYFSGRGSKREQDFFTRRGYITVHPDYRGYSSTTPQARPVSEEKSGAPSEAAAIVWPWYGASPAFPAHHDFYQGYAHDVLALMDALKKARPAIMDLDRIGIWGHSMGGGIAARMMALSRDIRAYVLWAPISADAEDNFYELTEEETVWLRETYGPAGDPAYRKISPISYFDEVSAPVQLHHGLTDTDVPSIFSQKMFDALTAQGKRAELFTYPGERHEFAAAWPLAASRALQFFDKYVKNAR